MESIFSKDYNLFEISFRQKLCHIETDTYADLHLRAAALFKYVWPFVST